MADYHWQPALKMDIKWAKPNLGRPSLPEVFKQTEKLSPFKREEKLINQKQEARPLISKSIRPPALILPPNYPPAIPPTTTGVVWKSTWPGQSPGRRRADECRHHSPSHGAEPKKQAEQDITAASQTDTLGTRTTTINSFKNGGFSHRS